MRSRKASGFVFNFFIKTIYILFKSETEIATFNSHINPIIYAKQSELISIFKKVDDLEVLYFYV